MRRLKGRENTKVKQKIAQKSAAEKPRRRNPFKNRCQSNWLFAVAKRLHFWEIDSAFMPSLAVFQRKNTALFEIFHSLRRRQGRFPVQRSLPTPSPNSTQSAPATAQTCQSLLNKQRRSSLWRQIPRNQPINRIWLPNPFICTLKIRSKHRRTSLAKSS